MTGLGTREPEEPPETSEGLPDPDAAAPGDEGSGRYRGRRRALTWAKRRGAQLGIAAVVAAVGVVLVGSSVLARTLSDSAAAPVVPPSAPASLSPSPTPAPLPLPTAPSPTNVAQFGTAPTPDPTPPPAPPEPTPEPTREDPPPDDPPDDPAPVELSFEAEDAELGGGAEVVERQSASGGEAVALQGFWPGNAVRFTGVAVDNAGEYELALHYTSRCCDTFARVSVNEGRFVVIEFPETPGSSIGIVTLAVELASGNNTILVTAVDDERAPNLDRITVTG